MTTQTNQTEEAEVKRLVSSWTEAVRSRDVERVMSHYAPDVLVFEVMPPLQYAGAERYRQIWEDWFASDEAPLGYDVRELTLTVSGEAGFSHALNCVRKKDASGNEVETWLRTTTGYAKRHGRWQITHEHWSMPVDPHTGMAMWDLTP